MDGGMFAIIVNFPPGEYLLYSKVSGGKVYYIANVPKRNVYRKHSGGRFAMRKVYYTTTEFDDTQLYCVSVFQICCTACFCLSKVWNFVTTQNIYPINRKRENLTRVNSLIYHRILYICLILPDLF